MYNEEELILRAQEGDKKSLSVLVKNYEQTVYNFAFKICRNKERAENTMQETFLSMVKSLNQFSGKSKLSTWLYTVISNHCMMLARYNRKHDYVTVDNDEEDYNNIEFVDKEINPEEKTENSELKKYLDDAIAKLDTDYRIVFLLRDVEGLSTEETAKIVNLSIPAVKSRLHRARSFLRNELGRMFKYGI